MRETGLADQVDQERDECVNLLNRGFKFGTQILKHAHRIYFVQMGSILQQVHRIVSVAWFFLALVGSNCLLKESSPGEAN